MSYRERFFLGLCGLYGLNAYANTLEQPSSAYEMGDAIFTVFLILIALIYTIRMWWKWVRHE